MENISPPILTEDICLEVDYPQGEGTRLIVLFEKNTEIPAQKKINRLINTPLPKGSNESLIINVLQGSVSALPITNQTIGILFIKGTQLNRDILKGADIEMTFEIAINFDLKIEVYIPLLDQIFSKTFIAARSYVPMKHLREEMEELSILLDENLQESIEIEDYETAKLLRKLQSQTGVLVKSLQTYKDEVTSDIQHFFEEKRREIALVLYDITKEKILNQLVNDYFNEKLDCKEAVENDGDEKDLKKYYELIKLEGVILNSNKPKKIQDLVEALRDLKFSILWRTPDYLIHVFEWLKNKRDEFRNQRKGDALIESGYKALETQNYLWLKQLNFSLLNLLPRENKTTEPKRTMGIV